MQLIRPAKQDKDVDRLFNPLLFSDFAFFKAGKVFRIDGLSAQRREVLAESQYHKEIQRAWQEFQQWLTEGRGIWDFAARYPHLCD